MKKRVDQLQRTKKAADPSDDIMVLMTWYCGICKVIWKQYHRRAEIRRLPAYVKVKGKRIETRLSNGVVMRAHPDCAQKMLNEMHAASGKTKKKIISLGGIQK